MSQKLLLLPELGGTITGTNVITPLNLINEEVSGHGLLSNEVTPRIVVNNLTASWTHVRVFNNMYTIFMCIMFVG